jgi:hypothetical protein
MNTSARVAQSKRKLPVTPSPLLMRIHLVRNSTSARFEKIPKYSLKMRILLSKNSLSANLALSE